MALTINSNISSLIAQRRFAKSTDSLSESFARLSSGLRVNRAKDDAAGLAIASDLKVDARVFAQGIRNVNDGVSLLNIAEGAAQELSSIVIRQRELATQASNGTLSSKQRLALHDEANALVNEFNRIVESTSFNNESLLRANQGIRTIQAGYGNEGGVAVELAQGLSRTVGDGTFVDNGNFATEVGSFDLSVKDVNNDGHDDLVALNGFVDDDVSVQLGNGDGSFKAAILSDVTAGTRLVVEDFNGDGFADIATPKNGNEGLQVSYGLGDGTFTSAVSFALGHGSQFIASEDFNDDGTLDLYVADNTGNTGATILFNDGAGNFNATKQIVTGVRLHDAAIEDYNGDGIFDIAAGRSDRTVAVMLGNGDGSFQEASYYSSGDSGSLVYSLVAGDFDGDGVQDIISANYNGNSLHFLRGNGDGTFAEEVDLTSFNTPNGGMETADFNGDGKLDFAVTFESESALGIYLGRGDGTFEAPVTYGGTATSFALAQGDFNEDGAIDLASAGSSASSIKILLANPDFSTRMDSLDLRTRQRALEEIPVLESALSRVNQELGRIGAAQSRLQVAAGNLTVSRENFTSAASQIVDVDVAFESARLVRGRILQQAGAAILGQANQQPAIAQTLLDRA